MPSWKTPPLLAYKAENTSKQVKKTSLKYVNMTLNYHYHLQSLAISRTG